MKAEPHLMADLFASNWWDCRFIPQRSWFPELCGNKPLNDHIASQSKIIEGLCTVLYYRLEVNRLRISSRSRSFQLPTLNPLYLQKTMELVCEEIKLPICWSDSWFLYSLLKDNGARNGIIAVSGNSRGKKNVRVLFSLI